ncbi:hypothetical protein [Acidisphaera sp. S103]|uniref:hypothetical protein n=1 Tax=Acidisphaera sp. S103 TaxID=1747223 RepID=UPI00131E2EAB|nr:hypothetical protein [Acidisphaera sp. S103]
MTAQLLDEAAIALKEIDLIEDAECLPRHLLDYPGTSRNIFLTMLAAPPIDDGESVRRSRSGA